MIPSFSVLAFLMLSVLSFSQSDAEVISVDPATIRSLPIGISAEEFRGYYSGCTMPVAMSPASCCATMVNKVEKSEEDLLDITDPELFLISASPNPTKGYLSVSIPPNLIGFQIQIIDMTGRFVGNPVPITSEKVDLNIEGEPGIYLISIQTEKEIITERILLDK